MDVVIAVAIGAGILAIAIWLIRVLATPPPPEPDPEDVIEVSQEYRCPVCGLRLTVTHAHQEELKPPRHCREEMEPV